MPDISSPEREHATYCPIPPNIDIQELFDNDYSETTGPEPVITEQEENATTPQEQRSDMVTELLSVCFLSAIGFIGYIIPQANFTFST